jgi:uncharacterized SAM-binding protein YcdF (DUF218 family)
VNLFSYKRFRGYSLRRLLLIPIVLLGLLLLLQAGYYLWVLTDNDDLQKADLIVVFEGGEYDRARTAYNLLDQAYAPNLLISPGTEKKLALYERKFQPSLPYDRVMENKSRTTLENAVHTSEILKENGFQSAILVTSWNHMPRSYFLLRAMTMRSGFRFQQHPVATGKLDQGNWYRHGVGWKMVYNEMAKLWGSLFELAHYRLTGQLTDQPPGKSFVAARLKRHLLFDIDRKLLHR